MLLRTGKACAGPWGLDSCSITMNSSLLGLEIAGEQQVSSSSSPSLFMGRLRLLRFKRGVCERSPLNHHQLLRDLFSPQRALTL